MSNFESSADNFLLSDKVIIQFIKMNPWKVFEDSMNKKIVITWKTLKNSRKVQRNCQNIRWTIFKVWVRRTSIQFNFVHKIETKNKRNFSICESELFNFYSLHIVDCLTIRGRIKKLTERLRSHPKSIPSCPWYSSNSIWGLKGITFSSRVSYFRQIFTRLRRLSPFVKSRIRCFVVVLNSAVIILSWSLSTFCSGKNAIRKRNGMKKLFGRLNSPKALHLTRDKSGFHGPVSFVEKITLR